MVIVRIRARMCACACGTPGGMWLMLLALMGVLRGLVGVDDDERELMWGV